MFVHQVSVYLINAHGTLCQLTGLLKDHNVDILALMIADMAEFGIVRFIVKDEDIQTCLDLLKEAGYSARKNHVVCAKIPNEPGGLHRALQLLENAGISVEYLYSFNYANDNNALIIFRLSDRETGAKLLIDNGFKIATQEEIDHLGE
ncbi:MAG: hypothetical protein IJM57_00255 [Lachnospiraceae bacterium]|nr:hypothetical protein [Lachnospiraceae bacterium]